VQVGVGGEIGGASVVHVMRGASVVHVMRGASVVHVCTVTDTRERERER
jgi:hypothetical protein